MPEDYKLNDEKVATGLQIGNLVCPPQGAYVCEFARTLIDKAGDGSDPGVALVSKYAIKPVVFAASRR